LVVLFGLGFLDHYNWLLTLPQLTFWFQLGGVLMMVVGGGWAAFQRHLGRLMGYAVIVGIGAALLALSQPDGLTLYFAGRLPRVVGLGVWALALALLREKAATLRFSDVQGLARQRPITAAALILAQFSLAGLPLLAGFPARLALLERVAEQQLWVALLALLGSVGLFIGALRSLAALVMGGEPGEAWRITESRWQSLFLLAGSAFLLLMGLFPQWSLTLLSGVPEVFEHLLP
jgi:NADH:ubiquinone oxidoreductase subunit 2 (subunit N)